MRLFIDASNLSVGGGITHLRAFLQYYKEEGTVFTSVEVAAADKTLTKLKLPDAIVPRTHEWLNSGLVTRWRWTNKVLTEWLAEKPTLLYQPGGGYSGPFHPYVTMSRNMLVFDRQEAARYKWTKVALRLWILREQQQRSFSRADGMIFISKYARQEVEKVTGELARARIIHHGVNDYFRAETKPQLPPEKYSLETPFTFLYVSVIDRYKHQDRLLEAFEQMAANGVPVRLELAGAMSDYAADNFKGKLERSSAAGVVHWYGKVDHKEMTDLYRRADAAIFASTCENMPNVLIEAMSSGLPVLCSKYPPMPEFLKDGGAYFDPEDTVSITDAVTTFFQDRSLRKELAGKSTSYSKAFSWEKCIRETIDYLNEIATEE